MAGSDERHLNILRKKIQSSTGGYTGIRQKASDSIREVAKQIRRLEISAPPLPPELRMAARSLLQSTIQLATHLGVEAPSYTDQSVPSERQAKKQSVQIGKKSAHLWMATHPRRSSRIERLLTKRAIDTPQEESDWPEE